jgi:phosphatidylserine/phosphatidylglycerophosphate/cardiolipin synthase-like enzyme
MEVGGKFMMLLKLLTILLFLNNSAFAKVSAYFNHNQKVYYTDPYRKISRQGDNLEEIILNQISRAKKSIFLAVQEFRLPLIAQALIKKHNEGLDIRVILEHDYNYNILSQRDSSADGEYEASKLNELRAFVDINRDGKIQKEELDTRDAIFMLQNANIKVLDDTSDNSRGSGLMHHKFMVIDDSIVVVSTANFTMSCIHGDILIPQSRGNANSMIVVESLGLGKIFKEEFLQLWGNGKRGKFGQNKTYRGPKTAIVDGTKITVQFSPTSQSLSWEESVNGLIAAHMLKAVKSIKAALFVFSDQKLTDVMEDRHNRGAEIGVIIEPKFAYRDYSELLDLMGLEMLDQKCQYETNNNPWKTPTKEAGMANMPVGDVLHHKFAVIDNQTVVMGSQNWSDAANFTNDETLIVIKSSTISELYSQEYLRIKQKAKLGPSQWLLDQIRQLDESCSHN